jgi:hypothetical protein
LLCVSLYQKRVNRRLFRIIEYFVVEGNQKRFTVLLNITTARSSL